MPVTVALMIATVEFLIATVEFFTPFWLELGLFVRQRKEQETHPVHVRGGLHEKMTVFLGDIYLDRDVFVFGCCSKPTLDETRASSTTSQT